MSNSTLTIEHLLSVQEDVAKRHQQMTREIRGMGELPWQVYYEEYLHPRARRDARAIIYRLDHEIQTTGNFRQKIEGVYWLSRILKRLHE